MSPFGREPGVVEVQPANRAADIERRLDRVENVVCAGHPRSVRNDRSRHVRPEMLNALRVVKRKQPAADRVEQVVAGCFIRHGAIDREVQNVVGDLGE